MRGDRVEILVDVGAGRAERFEIVATKDGRKLEVKRDPRVVEVNELTRNGDVVKHNYFMTPRILALLEHPAAETAAQPKRAVKVAPGQMAIDEYRPTAEAAS